MDSLPDVDLVSQADAPTAICIDDVESDSEGFASDDLVELFSVPRVASFVRAMGGQSDTSLDLASPGAQCRDFLDATDQAFGLQTIYRVRPKMLSLTPPCTMFSQLTQRWNLKLLTEYEQRVKLDEAETLFDYAIQSARTQHARGGYFFLEQPSGASSWKRLQRNLAATPMPKARGHPERTTSFVIFDQCRYGFVSPRGAPMKKSTKFWTNSPKIIAEFNHKTCKCTTRHQRIEGKQNGHQLSQWAQKFPPQMCAAIAKCIMDES